MNLNEKEIRTDAVQIRYSQEAKNGRNLSCGGAINFAEIQSHETLADLGCGRGRDVIKAAGLAKFAYGIDFTKTMIDTAWANLALTDIRNASFRNADIEDLPLEDNSIDVVISNCTINHAPDKSRVYAEIHRVLKPGGRFVVSDIIAESEIPRHIATDPEAIAGCYGGSIPKDQYFSAIQKSGFNNIEILEESNPYDKNGILIRSITLRSYKK